MSPIFSMVDGSKVQVGWGANCNVHRAASGGGTGCNKSLAYGRQHLSDDECCLLLKRWLVMGLDAPANLDQRAWHVGVNVRVACREGLDAEELERRARMHWETP